MYTNVYIIIIKTVYKCIQIRGMKMKHEEFRKEKHHGRDHHKRKDRGHKGAKTFRRGRAIAFLEMMNLKRSTIKQQLEAPEFQTIQPILVGELKAIDMVINEFIQLFEIQEDEMSETVQEDIVAEELPLQKKVESQDLEDGGGLE